MALSIERLRDQSPGGAIVADRRLVLAADRETLVDENDPRASFLLCGAGGEVPASEASRLGLSVQDGRVVQHYEAPKQMEAPQDKQAAKPADKSRVKGENKSGRKR